MCSLINEKVPKREILHDASEKKRFLGSWERNPIGYEGRNFIRDNIQVKVGPVSRGYRRHLASQQPQGHIQPEVLLWAAF